MFKNNYTYFMRKRIKVFVTIVAIISLIFILYQILYLKQLNEQLHNFPISNFQIRGIHPKQINFYLPNELNKFICIQSKEEIDYSQVNDDYCDCLDGSDEPGTNACSNGIFFCLFQDANNKYKKFVPSRLVNDGICDCCDGSDEWSAGELPFRLDDLLQRTLGRYQTPCRNICLL